MANNLRNKSETTKPSGSKNLLTILAISIVVLYGIEYFQKDTNLETSNAQKLSSNPLNPTSTGLFKEETIKTQISKPVALSTANYNVEIDLKGGSIKNLELANYVVTKGEEKLVKVFNTDSENPMMFDAGWLAENGNVPNSATEWSLDSQTNDSIVLKYDNTLGLTFYRTFFFNDSFTINIEDKVINNSINNVKIAQYSQVHHVGERESRLENSFTNYTGPQAIVDDKAIFADYDKLQDGDTFTKMGKNIWAGITKMYFAAALIPDNTQNNTVKFKYTKIAGQNYYTALVRSDVKNLMPEQNIIIKYSLYAGPKSTKILGEQGVDEAIKLPAMLDYGWFHIIAKAFFDLMMYFNGYVNSLAISIIIVTIILKLALFPLASKSYKSMAHMRKIQPELKALQAKHGDDRQALSLAMMALYKKHGVSPASGCWPMLVQIPIFFAMYKVILIGFEFRQADLGLWIHDMSVKDPYFVLPILMGITMVLQQRMNPQPLDKTQQMVMNIMPVVFTALFLFFPSGLVLYWLTNNVLSIAQQYIIMKKEG